MLPRPRFRLPLLAALAIAGAAFVARSVMRGFDFKPDMPTDAVVLVALLVVIALVAYVRADEARHGQSTEDDDAGPPREADRRR